MNSRVVLVTKFIIKSGCGASIALIKLRFCIKYILPQIGLLVLEEIPPITVFMWDSAELKYN